MKSLEYKKNLAIRFGIYLAIFIGLLSVVLEFGPIIQAESTYRFDNLVGIKHTLAPPVINSLNQEIALATDSAATTTFGDLPENSADSIAPVSTDYGIVIEKINANAKVIPNIDPANEPDYARALAQGVAAAKGSTDPGHPGNIYIFSHSTDAPWNVARFNAVFYLLRELEPGDRVVLFYKNRRYNYIVFDKNIIKSDDISYLLNRYDKPVLTLQTCDPPGTTINRLIVRAKLLGS